jgi:hypothetical protein
MIRIFAASSSPNPPRPEVPRAITCAQRLSTAGVLRHERADHDRTPGHANKGFIGRDPV